MDKGKEIFLKDLGKRIASLRVLKGITQSELALRCDKDRQSIHRLEKGQINPSAYYLQQVAEALNEPLSEIFVF